MKVFELFRLIALGAISLAAALPGSRVLAQAIQSGSIEGRVMHAAAGTNLKQVRVAIDGTTLETFTNEAGEFRLAGVPVGEVTLRASASGLSPQTTRVRVAPGAVARHDFDLGARDAAAPSREQTVLLDAFTVAERELS